MRPLKNWRKLESHLAKSDQDRGQFQEKTQKFILFVIFVFDFFGQEMFINRNLYIAEIYG